MDITRSTGLFNCNNESLNSFLKSEEIRNYEIEQFGRTTFVYCEKSLAAYYTICYGQLRKEYLKKWESFVRLSEWHLDNVPAIIIGRLAVDMNWQNKGIGRTIIQRIAMLALENSKFCGLRLLLVQAKDKAFPFYEKLGFKYVSETREEIKRIRMKRTKTMFFDISVLNYLKND